MLAPLDPDFDPLVSWLLARGGAVGAICLRGVGPERGIYATADIASGDTLLRVPMECCLSDEVARATPAGRAVVAGWEGPAREALTLAAALAELRVANPPEWQAWLRSVPTRVPGHPAQFSPGERRAWVGTSVGVMLPDIAARHAAEWRWLREYTAGFAAITEAEWAEVRTLVTSRQYHLHPYEGTALVPIADLFNHARNPEVEWHYDRGERAFTMSARRAVSAAAPLHTSYGAKSNARLLLHYGFTLPDNPDDDVLVDFGRLGVVSLGHALRSGNAIDLCRQLLITGGRPGQRRRGWRRFASALGRLRSGLPASTFVLAQSENLARVVAGERAVIDTWLARCSAGAVSRSAGVLGPVVGRRRTRINWSA